MVLCMMWESVVSADPYKRDGKSLSVVRNELYVYKSFKMKGS